MTTESQKLARKRWDKENMAMLSCRVTKETANKFKSICTRNGITVNAALLKFVKSTIEAETQE